MMEYKCLYKSDDLPALSKEGNCKGERGQGAGPNADVFDGVVRQQLTVRFRWFLYETEQNSHDKRRNQEPRGASRR